MIKKLTTFTIIFIFPVVINECIYVIFEGSHLQQIDMRNLSNKNI